MHRLQFLCVLFCFLPGLLRGFSTSSSRSANTRLFGNVASEILVGDSNERDAGKGPDSQNAKKRLSRPERKALEREKKAKRSNANHRKHNFAARSKVINGHRAPGEGRYDLHSNAVSELNKDSSPNDVMQAIKRAQNLHDAHDLRAIERFILEETEEDFAYGFRGSILARLTVAALHMEHHELARKAIVERRLKHRDSMLPFESDAIVRGLLRVHNVTDALEVIDDELSLPLQGTALDSEENQDRIKHRARAFASVASRHFFEGEPSLAVRSCSELSKLGPVAREAGLTAEELDIAWSRIIRGACQCEAGRRAGTVNPCVGVDVELPCNLVYAVLNAMTTFPSNNDDRTYEALANGLVRRTVFVTGAVDMQGLPDADRGEAAFIGRSNVGKSSLVNMLTNRKSLAYTSKTPGKTQQFNYFAVNDKPDLERQVRFGDDVAGDKDPDAFYLVDLPGFGFAKVPDHIKQGWSAFMAQYMTKRKSLKVVFHLVDARHGPTTEDARIMKQVGEILPKAVKYVVILTKADKNVKGKSKNSGAVAQQERDRLRSVMKDCGVGNAPVILTSSETKLGRDEVWRYLRLAAEG